MKVAWILKYGAFYGQNWRVDDIKKNRAKKSKKNTIYSIFSKVYPLISRRLLQCICIKEYKKGKRTRERVWLRARARRKYCGKRSLRAKCGRTKRVHFRALSIFFSNSWTRSLFYAFCSDSSRKKASEVLWFDKLL